MSPILKYDKCHKCYQCHKCDIPCIMTNVTIVIKGNNKWGKHHTNEYLHKYNSCQKHNKDFQRENGTIRNM